MKIKLIIILLLSYLVSQIIIFNNFKNNNQEEAIKYNIIKNIYKKDIKKIWNNVNNINNIIIKLNKFKQIKQDWKIFYLKHFLEWILPNNNNWKEITISKNNKYNKIEYFNSDFVSILKILNKLKQLKVLWYITDYRYSNIQNSKWLYRISIEISTKNLQKYLKLKENQDFQLLQYNALFK